MPSSATSGQRMRNAHPQSHTHAYNSASDSLPAPPLQHQTKLADPFEPCTATASFFLYAQRNVVRCLHHDTLAIERKFEKHNDDVVLLSADNVSERGAGRLVVSYDVEQTAIIWDLFTGDEVARFASYEVIRVAAWMRDGSIAFGNSQGNVILFEPSTSEHISARTIYDPVTALAPAPDCSTFAIGYLNGSILVATLQPCFTILHTLSTNRVPSPITGLGWHNSSSKQKTEMLATQTADGDLRIWSVPKSPGTEQPRVIRIIGAPESLRNHRTWFAWSKNGRIVQFCDGDTRVWDVRTKKVTHESVPTIDDFLAIAAYSPNGTLFTVGRSYSVQQYDLATHHSPIMVKNVQHAPPNAPPTPPDLIDESKKSRTVPVTILPDEPVSDGHDDTTSSEEESYPMSPLQKIVRGRNQLEDESRDLVAPLSPVSSRKSLKSVSSHGRRRRQQSRQRYLEPDSEKSYILNSSSVCSGNDSASIRSTSSNSSQKHTSSALRSEMVRSPDQASNMKSLDLFPFVRARLSEVKFRSPRYGKAGLTPEVLRNEMLSVVFGWDSDIESLIRDEQSRHRPGSATNVLLSKWLGDLGADTMAQLVGAESMTSSDWMLLALSCHMGEGSQKHVGQAFVKRLLETGETHPAVAILLGLGEMNEAVEVYVSRKLYLEAILLTCLMFPNDWQRQSHLVRRWGESAVVHGQAELAVRCFSCTTIESSEPWFSPRSQDAVYQAQQRALAPHTLSPPASPPSETPGARMTAKMASLKLITSFGDEPSMESQRLANTAVTPIIDTALTPSTHGQRRRDLSRGHRDRSQSRTATPGGMGRIRFPSVTREPNAVTTPLATSRVQSRLSTPALREFEAPKSAIDDPRTAVEGFSSYDYDSRKKQRAASLTRSSSRNHNGLQIAMVPVVEIPDALASGTSARSLAESATRSDISTGRSIDRYIDSLDTYSAPGSQRNPEHYPRAQSRTGRTGKSGRSRSRARAAEGATPVEVTFIPPSKRSPSSPVPMTADEVNKHVAMEPPDLTVESTTTRLRTKADYSTAWTGSPEAQARRTSTSVAGTPSHTATINSQYSGAQISGQIAGLPSIHRIKNDDESTTSPIPTRVEEADNNEYAMLAPQRFKGASEADVSRKASHVNSKLTPDHLQTPPKHLYSDLGSPLSSVRSEPTTRGVTPRAMTRKELAARELEERRLSLARRPSVPVIPHPAELSSHTTKRSPRAGTDPFPILSSASYADFHPIARSQTAGAEQRMRFNPSPALGSFVATGLPPTPKAMQRPATGSAESDEYFKQNFTPIIPDAMVTLAPVSYQKEPKAVDDFGPLLPSVYYQKPPITRSYSAPPENVPTIRKMSGESSTNRSHGRKGSTIEAIPEVSASFEAGHHDNDRQVIVLDHCEPEELSTTVVQDIPHPPILAELAHLAGPPPPPPPPTIFRTGTPPRMSGVIDIVMDDMASSRTSTSTPPSQVSRLVGTPTVSSNVTAASSTVSRHRTPGGENTIIGSRATTPPNSSSLGNKLRNVAGRIRSSSRNHTRSPPTGQHDIVIPFTTTSPAPYETVVGSPPSFYFQPQRPSMDAPHGEMTAGGSGTGAGTPPNSGGYRNPKEVRANMTPQMLQSASDPAKLQQSWGRSEF